MARRRFPHPFQDAGRVGGNQRIAVHFRNGERRLVAAGDNGRRQHTTQRIGQCHRFIIKWFDAGQHGGARRRDGGQGGGLQIPLGIEAAL